MNEIEDLEFNNSIARVALDQASECLAARTREAVHRYMNEGLQNTLEERREEQEKLFDIQVKWAFNKAVDHIRANGFTPGAGEDDLGFFNLIMIQELEKTPSFSRMIRVSTSGENHSGLVSLFVEGFVGKNKLGKTIKFDSRIFEPLPLPSNFDPPERTTIDEDMMNFLIE